jgi:hypothetical protein
MSYKVKKQLCEMAIKSYNLGFDAAIETMRETLDDIAAFHKKQLNGTIEDMLSKLMDKKEKNQ